MAKKRKNAISPTRAEDYPEWYQQVIKAADLAEVAPVRGCMVIKPWGYSLWENMQRELDQMFKATGHENAYFKVPVSEVQPGAQIWVAKWKGGDLSLRDAMHLEELGLQHLRRTRERTAKYGSHRR